MLDRDLVHDICTEFSLRILNLKSDGGSTARHKGTTVTTATPGAAVCQRFERPPNSRHFQVKLDAELLEEEFRTSLESHLVRKMSLFGVKNTETNTQQQQQQQLH